MVRWNLAWLINALLFITYFFMLDFKGWIWSIVWEFPENK